MSADALSPYDPATAAAHGLVRCHGCGRVSSAARRECPRCDASLHARKANALPRTVALSIAALLLYFPANILPVLRVESSVKGSQRSTILSGVIQFWQEGDYPVALIIFTASVLIPILKLLALGTLCYGACTGRSPRAMTQLYRVTDFIGRWSMVDVFVVAILVGVVQLGSVMTINPGAGAMAFAGVVVLTILAAESFDPRLIWDRAASRDTAPSKEKNAKPNHAS
jgi:paraquat-inducible protein A